MSYGQSSATARAAEEGSVQLIFPLVGKSKSTGAKAVACSKHHLVLSHRSSVGDFQLARSRKTGQAGQKCWDEQIHRDTHR